MSGTNPAATFGQTNFTTQTATQYKTQIDSNSIVMQRAVDCFAPRQSTTPAMNVTLDPGHILRGTTLTEVAAQTTGTITAPAGNPRIDRVVVDRMTGAASVVTGTPAASPSPPAIPTGKLPICQVLLQTTSTTITNAMITDERVLESLGRGTAGEENMGQWLKDDGAGNMTLNVNGTLRDDGTGKLTTGLTTEAGKTAAATTDLGTMASNIGVINGNTTITSFGNSASITNPFYIMRVAGAPLLTNSANLILPGGANYQCAAGDILFCKFEGSSKWRVAIQTASGKPVVSTAASPGIITGLLPTAISGSNTTAAVTVSAGSAADSTGSTLLSTTTLNWAVSNGNAINGFEGGFTLPNSSTIHFFICSGSSGTGIFASTSLTPTLPAGYNSSYRRMFSLRTDSSGSLMGGTPIEVSGGAMLFYLDSAKFDVNVTNLGTTASLYALPSVPTDIRVQPKARYSTNLGGSNTVLVSSPDEPDVAPSAYNASGTSFGLDISDTNGNAQSASLFVTTNTSAQIRARANQASTNFTVWVSGWTDFRRN